MVRKTCKVEQCNNHIFGKGYCKYHQYLREDRKKIRLVGRINSRVVRKKVEKKQLLGQDIEFYIQEIWDKRLHVCFNCDANLGNMPYLYYFDHILEKQRYPELRHESENMCLLCGDCHSTKTNGILSPKLKELRELTKKRFDK